MPLGGRRAGPAMRFDIHNDTTGALVVRNIDAATVSASHATSLTAQQVIDRVAAEHHVVSNGVRVSAHMSIGR